MVQNKKKKGNHKEKNTIKNWNATDKERRVCGKKEKKI